MTRTRVRAQLLIASGAIVWICVLGIFTEWICRSPLRWLELVPYSVAAGTSVLLTWRYAVIAERRARRGREEPRFLWLRSQAWVFAATSLTLFVQSVLLTERAHASSIVVAMMCGFIPATLYGVVASQSTAATDAHGSRAAS